MRTSKEKLTAVISTGKYKGEIVEILTFHIYEHSTYAVVIHSGLIDEIEIDNLESVKYETI